MVMSVLVAMVPRRQREQEATARRVVATRWVVTAREERRRGRYFSLFVIVRGKTLFTQSWAPITVKIKGVLVLMHGLNEHSGIYDHFAKKLNDASFKMYAMDWIVHGGSSDGLHGYVQSLDYAMSDLKAFLEKVLVENSGLPCFFFGHSAGAACTEVLDLKVAACVKNVVLTSPAIRVQPSHLLDSVLMNPKKESNCLVVSS